MNAMRRARRLGVAVTLVLLALGCGRYGAPIRPEPKPEPPPEAQEEESAPTAETPEGDPDFRLNLPGLPGGEAEDE